MDSPGFPSLVQNFTDLTDENYVELKKLSDQYPYSQLLHLIMARAARDLKHSDHEQVLHQSAVYSTDRQVLKWVMTTPVKEVVTEVPQPGEKKTAPVTVVPIEIPHAIIPEPIIVPPEPIAAAQK